MTTTTSPWNEVVNRTMFNNTKKGKYCDLSMEHKLLLKIQNENLLPKGFTGSYSVSALLHDQ